MKKRFGFGQLFSKKAPGFYLECIASVLALIVSIIGPLNGGLANSVEFGANIVVFFAVGILATLASLWLNFDFMVLIPVAFFSVGFGQIILYGGPAVADAVNNIQFQGGNITMVASYLVLSALAVILSVIACFIGTKRA